MLGTIFSSKSSRKIASNTAFLMIEKLINIFLSFFVGIYVARYLGPTDYGHLQYANNFVGLFLAIASLGTSQIVVRDLVNELDKKNEILGTTFVLLFSAGLVTSIVTIILSLIINDEEIINWLIIIYSSNLILQSFQIFDYWFKSKVLSKYSVYARVSGRLISALSKLVFIFFKVNLIFFALTVIISGVIQAIIWGISYRLKGEKINLWRFDVSYAKRLLKNTWPLILSGISIAIYMKVDIVMLKILTNSFTVGNYAIASNLSSVWYFLPVIFSSSFFPSVVELQRTNKKKYEKRLIDLYQTVVFFSLIIAIFIASYSDFIIQLFFGEEYRSASEILKIHIWAGIFVSLGVIRSSWIIAENYQVYGMIFTITGALINIILNLILIPSLGGVGAAWATLISYLISAYLSGVCFKGTRIAFRMQTKATLHAILIVPVLVMILKNLRERNDEC